MGALRYMIDLTDDYGNTRSPSITTLHIWRSEEKGDGVGLKYYASRQPPAEAEYVEEANLTGVTYVRHYTNAVEFYHDYDDGAELCVARAILALKEAGLNV